MAKKKKELAFDPEQAFVDPELVGKFPPRKEGWSVTYSGPPEEPAEEPDATPAAEELAQKSSIDLSEVEGSGSDGRILKSDVEEELKNG